MHRSLTFLLFLCLTACSSCATVGPGQYRYELVKQYYSTVFVATFCNDPEIPSKYGSGVVISHTQVVTAAHVVSCPSGPPKRITVENLGKLYETRLDDFLPEIDIASIRVKGNFVTYSPTTRNYPRVGDEVCTVTNMSVRKCGYVIKSEKDTLTIAMKAVRGNSGSAIYNSRGEVVGILVAGTMNFDIEAVTFAVPTELWVGQI